MDELLIWPLLIAGGFSAYFVGTSIGGGAGFLAGVVTFVAAPMFLAIGGSSIKDLVDKNEKASVDKAVALRDISELIEEVKRDSLEIQKDVTDHLGNKL